MHRPAVFAGLFLCLYTLCGVGQTSSPAVSDPQAISLAQQSLAALTRGASVTDITLNANVTSILGSDNETGMATFRAKGTMESRIDLNLSAGTLSEVRNIQKGGPAGAWSRNGSTATPQAAHNTLTDAALFFPVLSSLSQFGNPNYLFKYIGAEQHNGLSTQHIQVSLLPSTAAPGIQQLSTTDFYLDPVSFLPLAASVKTHPDQDKNKDIPLEILFANYQLVSGIQVPFRFQKMLNGGVILDAIVTKVVLNTGLLDSTFTLQ